MKKKRNPTDSTRRNVQARNKMLALHAARLKRIEIALHDAWTVRARMNNLERRLMKLERQRGTT